MPISLKNMKSIDLFCTSPASTAVLDHQPTTILRRPLRRLHSYFSDHQYIRNAPCISELPITPTPHTQNSRESSTRATGKNIADLTIRRKSSADVNDLYGPPGSSRYLLSDLPYLDSALSSDGDSLALVPSKPVRSRDTHAVVRRDDCLRRSSLLDSAERKSPDLIHSRSVTSTSRHLKDDDRRVGLSDSPTLRSSAPTRSRDQVVVLWVSLHCRACEGKLRKHLSKMEGVTSFSIDLATKKVIVVGNVTPLDVLTSISKVKNAQFWPSPSSTSPSSSSSASTV
ncbi:hypothetical protein Ancab_007239 [Ancistrocladus abbreviatus]